MTNKQLPPDGAKGDWRIETFEVSKDEADFCNLRARCNPNARMEYIKAGTYKRLMRGGTVVMSNTPMEINTNQPIIRKASGQVLINGLGLGVVLSLILEKPQVRQITVVEKHSDVIDLVAPTFRDARLKIIHADAFEYQPRGMFDAVWHDIWDAICEDNLKGMARLHRKYARRAVWQDAWCADECANWR